MRIIHIYTIYTRVVISTDSTAAVERAGNYFITRHDIGIAGFFALSGFAFILSVKTFGGVTKRQ